MDKESNEILWNILKKIAIKEHEYLKSMDPDAGMYKARPEDVYTQEELGIREEEI